MTHPVFSLHRSEHSMLRYLRRLADRDLALDRSMIPLGSCTMKLNATTEMIPITWPEFSAIHPYAPEEQVAGYLELIDDLAGYLCRITGYDAVSLQPNAGSQGELAGLLAIRAYQGSIGEGHRDICLIPSSAHGTNAASAVMAGMKVVVVATDGSGNVDLSDLEAKASEHSERLAAAMITYPSTHGVFEEGVRRLIEHRAPTRWPGLCRWGESECDGGAVQAGRLRGRRRTSESPQDLHHPPRGWWAGRRPGWGEGTSGPLPAQPPDEPAARARRPEWGRSRERLSGRPGSFPSRMPMSA